MAEDWAGPDPLTALLLGKARRCIAAGHRPVFGLNGPVGAGKTTLSQRLRGAFDAAGLQLAVASIDDAYLPLQLRRRRMAGNPFGVSRVPPGSHDPGSLLDPIQNWRALPWRAPGVATAALQLPRFDKRICGGEGDRVADWQGEADALLLEGWMLGCRRLPLASLRAWPGLAALDERQRRWLVRCNRSLQAYADLWDAINALVVLWPRDWRSPRRWRLQAEARQRRAGGGWLEAVELERIIQATLKSLPPELHQQPLLATACWVRELDGRRRCLWQGSGASMTGRLAQSSSV
jgi:D-glycerate 3-kinase